MRNIGRDGLGRDSSPSRPNTGRAGSPNRPQPSRLSPSRPQPNLETGRAGSPSQPPYKNGALGESALPGSTLPNALPESALPKRKRLVHTPPPWAPEGSTFFITINCIPRGQNQLAIPESATLIEESLRVRIEKAYWWPRLTLLMPDHIHTLMVFSPDQEMTKVISDWKRYLARHAGIYWQRDFFDYRIRNEASLQEKWSYILQNPVRAGLVTAAEHWPYVWINGIDKNDTDGSPSRPSLNIKNDPGRAGSPSQPSPNINDDMGRVGSPSRPLNVGNGIPGRVGSLSRPLNVGNGIPGRAGSPNRPQPSRPPYKNGALGESALPKTSKKP